MAPSRNSHKTKKNKARTATHCAECGKAVPAASRVDCVCTRVIFCSAACSAKGLNHQCPGAPDPVIDMQQRLRDLKASGDTPISGSATENRKFKEEYHRDITIPLRTVLLQEACAYTAGVQYKQRVLGVLNDRTPFVSDARTGQVQLRVLESDALAFRYLEQAAKAGIGLAMQSLSNLYEEGQGCRKSWSMAREWLWRAVLKDSAGAAVIFNGKIVLRNELTAQVHIFEQLMDRIGARQSFAPSGPNIASLLLVFFRQMQNCNFTLPPFASIEPSCRVTGSVRHGTTGPVVIPGSDQFIRAVLCMRQLEMRKHAVLHPVYGRRGIAKLATAHTMHTASRSSENQLFCVPPAPACDERPDRVDEWVARARRGEYDEKRSLPVQCVHHEREDGGGARIVCQKCICDAVERLQAVATNSVALSLEESLSNRGQRAIWRTPDGKLKSELFKDYCRGELEATLAAIAMTRRDFDTPIATPLFAAQDPNLFWPLICHHGSIRAALEHVAPHVNWTDSLGPAKFTVPDPSPIVTSEHYDVGPGCILHKCGNNLCFKLEPNRKKGDFLACVSCAKRLYCSRECLVQDWSLHKRECVAGAGKPEPVARFPETKPKKQSASMLANEEVVVHGLQAKPEYNGKIGRITGSLTEEGRYPVELSEDKHAIAVKPLNLYRLGVEPQYSRKKGRKFRCVHALELCNDCQLDLVVVGRLWKLFSTGELLSQSAVEEVGDYHFASLECMDQEGAFCEIDKDFPMEAHGVKSVEKKMLLKSILEVKAPSEMTAVAIVGLVCYASRDDLTTRAYVPRHCVKLVQLWNKG